MAASMQHIEKRGRCARSRDVSTSMRWAGSDSSADHEGEVVGLGILFATDLTVAKHYVWSAEGFARASARLTAANDFYATIFPTSVPFPFSSAMSSQLLHQTRRVLASSTS